MGQKGIVNPVHIENGPQTIGLPIQSTFPDDKPFQMKFTSNRRNFVTVAIGITIMIVIITGTVCAVIWALQRPKLSSTLRVQKTNNTETEICLTEHCIYAATSLLRNMDLTAEPCEDFYQYACGNWAKSNPLPEDKSSYDTFNKLRDDLQIVIKELLGSAVDSKDSNATTSAKLLYQSCVNETIIEDRRDEPLQNLIKELGGWPVLDNTWNETTFDYSETLGKLKLFNNDIMVSQWVGADSKNSTVRRIQLDQPELGLPSRDYYLQENTKVLKAYYKFMVDIAKLLGANEETAEKDMTEILMFEQQLANITEPAERRRNYTEIHFDLTLGELEEIIHQINWTRYFDAFLPMQLNSTEPITLYGFPYFRRLGNLLETTSKRLVANYLMWRFVNHRVNNLDQRFSKKKQELFQVLYGRAKEPERWKTCTVYVNAVMGMAVGSMFVKNHFNEASKHDAEAMIANIQDTFIEILSTLDWMDEDTKQVAIEKARKISKRIGYPEFILVAEELDKESEGLLFNATTYFENVLINLQHMARWEQEKLRFPVNKTLWSTAPVVVNAFYSRSKNQILFPAGILQPPFYHSSYPKSMNYGGIGVVIGHEISHGFDDRGRQFDEEGNLKLWWNSTSVERFHKKAQCIIEQYSNYEIPEITEKINGIVTQGENIADNGGIRQAFQAYQKWVNKHGEEPLLPELNATHTQLFFLNFAQVWCTVMTPEAAFSRLRQGPHSPGRFRVIGTLSNSEEFSKAYQCPEGSPMNPKHKCSLW